MTARAGRLTSVAALAPLVIVVGVCLALAFLALILLSLYDLWLRKAVA